MDITWRQRKGSVHQVDITSFSVHATNENFKIHEAKLIVQKGEMEKCTIRAGDFNTLLSVIDRTRKQRIRKDIVELTTTINQLHPVDIYTTFHPTTEA